MRKNAWDIILKVVLRMTVLTIGMRTEKKFRTSKNISKRNKKKKKKIRRRRRNNKMNRKRRKEKRRKMMGGKAGEVEKE
jgi:hypothetical protein